MKKSILIIATLSYCFVYAQTPKQNFAKAEEFYKNANYKEAITLAESVKKSLGRLNPKIEALLFMAYHNNEEYLKAKIAFETLKRLVPDSLENSDAFILYKITSDQLDIQLTELETAFDEEQNKIPPSLFYRRTICQ
ncbi:hypothetical protein [Winogradskyella psychrotolerans]|uniref:hypothetical protein n=1 Tax=Winogradskyella psychrotolerans TaxID=1344585 RepID=UPI001267F63D|nr:hypothetical protein [Winogradskyella psychrotolerans]